MQNKLPRKTAEAIANPGDTWGEVGNRIRNLALQQAGPQLARVGVGAAGVGATIAGLRQLLRLRTEQDVRDREEASRPKPVNIYSYKRAGIVNDVNQSVKDVASGAFAQSPHHFPWFMPAAAGVGLASGLAGYKLTNNLLDSIRNKAKAKELERARSEYQQAMMGAQNKVSEERSKLAMDCDRIVNALTADGSKLSQSQPGDTQRMLGLLAGLYLTAMGGAAGYGALKGFKTQRAGSKTRAVERAQLEQQLSQQRQLTPVVTQVGDEGPINAAGIA